MSSPSLTIAGGALGDRSWVLLGLIGASLAAVGNVTIYVIYLMITGVPLHVALIAGSQPQPLSVVQVILASALPGLVAALAAATLTRWTTEPRRWFLGAGVIVALVSILGPLNQPGAGGNQLVLALMHVVAAIAIMSAILPWVPAHRA